MPRFRNIPMLVFADSPAHCQRSMRCGLRLSVDVAVWVSERAITLAWMGLGAAFAPEAQSSQAISLNFAGAGSGNASGFSFTGMGSVQFGTATSPASVNISGPASTWILRPPSIDGEQLNATGSAIGGIEVLSGSARGFGGAGKFTGATGSNLAAPHSIPQSTQASNMGAI
jgi:hypothetical protein